MLNLKLRTTFLIKALYIGNPGINQKLELIVQSIQ